MRWLLGARSGGDADIHTAGIQTQVQAIIAELEGPEKNSDVLFLLPTRKSQSYTALRSALENIEIPYIDFTDKANRDTVARDHQVRIIRVVADHARGRLHLAV